MEEGRGLKAWKRYEKGIILNYGDDFRMIFFLYQGTLTCDVQEY